MKRAIKCLNCGEIKRYSESYAIRVEEVTRDTLTGGTVENELIGRVCISCAAKMGYVTREERKKKVGDN